MSTATVTLLVLAAITYTLKSAGPLALAGRRFPAWIDRIVAVLPIPLLAALVVTSTLANGEEWVCTVGGTPGTWVRTASSR